jgi:3-oxoacyl-[acyl-carrier protein] reductase
MIETGLRDRAVVVTGGAAGIGHAVARRFAAEGARVSAWDVADAASLVAELGEEHFDARRVDVTDGAAVDAAAAAVVERWGRIDVLVNNAGIVRDKQLVKWRGGAEDGDVVSMLDDATFDAVIGVNLKGVFLCARAVVPHMIRGGGGVILNASSVVGLYGNFGQTNYAATKAAVVNMTKTWARELGKHRIRVNAVAPGFIATEILSTVPPKVVDTMVAHTPLQRMGTADEIAEAYLWLASDAASFVTGAVLSVDGGLVPGT